MLLVPRGLTRNEKLADGGFGKLGAGLEHSLGVAEGSAGRLEEEGGQAAEQRAALERSEAGSVDSEPVNNGHS